MLDTNICSYFIKNNPACVRTRLQASIDDGIAISTIVLAELVYGVEASAFPEKNRYTLYKTLVFADIRPFGNSAVATYGKLRAALRKRGTPIGLMDMLIAAHAISEGLTLVTNNVREFERVEGLSIVNWAVP